MPLSMPGSFFHRRLTIPRLRDKITPSADVVELVDSLDLGAVTSVKVFWFQPSRKTEYAGMMKLVNIQDLGSCAQA